MNDVPYAARRNGHLIGIDPGMEHIGLVALVDGQLRDSFHASTDSSYPRGKRLWQIHHLVGEWLDRWRPDAVALEGYAMGARFGREQMGEVGGVIKLACHGFWIDPVVWQPGSWMKLVVGSGKTPKDQIRLEIYKRYAVDLKTTHELDAFGVAMAEHMALTGAKRPRPKKVKEAPDATEEVRGLPVR